MRILWVSVSPSASTGYGKITNQVVGRLLDRHEVICACQSDVIVWGGAHKTKLFNGREALTLSIANPQVDAAGAAKAVRLYAEEYGADVLIGFWDAFALSWMGQAGLPFLQYIPVDGPVTDRWVACTRDAMRVVLYSKFGYDEFSRFVPPSLLSYVPHGIDVQKFIPLGRKTGRLRELIDSTTPIPKDAFLVTSVGANYTERKRTPLLMRTFAQFAREHADAHLYLHCNARAWSGNGYDLEALARDFGIADRVHFPRNSPDLFPFSDEQLNVIFNASDLYATSSAAEGFGVPLIEAQAAGTPVLCPANSSQVELVEGHGYVARNIDSGSYVDYPMYVGYGTYYPEPDQSDMLRKMEEAYADEVKRLRYGRMAREFALGYRWEEVMRRWLSLLDSVEDELKVWKSILA